MDGPDQEQGHVQSISKYVVRYSLTCLIFSSKDFSHACNLMTFIPLNISQLTFNLLSLAFMSVFCSLPIVFATYLVSGMEQKMTQTPAMHEAPNF